jgi:hypothetical protein
MARCDLLQVGLVTISGGSGGGGRSFTAGLIICHSSAEPPTVAPAPLAALTLPPSHSLPL